MSELIQTLLICTYFTRQTKELEKKSCQHCRCRISRCSRIFFFFFFFVKHKLKGVLKSVSGWVWVYIAFNSQLHPPYTNTLTFKSLKIILNLSTKKDIAQQQMTLKSGYGEQVSGKHESWIQNRSFYEK